MSNEQRDTSPGPLRRQFLGALGAGAVLGPSAAAADPPKDAPAGADAIPRRPLGKTGLKVSALGFGGHHLGDFKTADEAIKAVHAAIDAGVNFFDNCWEYWNGRSEDWLGRALRGKRDKVVLMTKVCTHGRDRKVAMQQLEESLKRLQTDHLDLWQIHECVYYNDPDRHFAKGGVVEALDEAKKAGKVRYVGFTGHKHPDIHLAMLSHGYPFDAVQMPLNVFDASYRSFEQRVLPEVVKRGMAGLGMKSMGGDGRPVLRGAVTAEEALRYAMSLPVAVTISGIDSMDVLRQNLAVARDFKPLTDKAMQALRRAGRGRTPGAVQIDDGVRRRHRPRAARLPAEETDAAVTICFRSRLRLRLPGRKRNVASRSCEYSCMKTAPECAWTEIIIKERATGSASRCRGACWSSGRCSSATYYAPCPPSARCGRRCPAPRSSSSGCRGRAPSSSATATT
jgi:aryl-alcohol dehydrogenase-like predicted oxidoreductase